MHSIQPPTLHRTPSKAASPALTPERKPLTPAGPTGRAKASPSLLSLSPGVAVADPPGLSLRERKRFSRDPGIEVLWCLIFAVGIQQARQSFELPQDRAMRSSWTWMALDVALGVLVRGLMNAMSDCLCQRREAVPAGPAPEARSLVPLAAEAAPASRQESRALPPALENRPADGPAQLESLLERANARPRNARELRALAHRIVELQQHHARAIGPGEAAWAIARLAQGALALPATATEPDMDAFAQSTDCLLAPARQAHRDKRISDEELQMATDHLERQVFDRLRGSPWALRGAALARVRAQIGQPD